VGSPLELTDRDVELLATLLKYRYLSTPQAQRLHFPSTQTALRRLRRLSASGYVTTFKSPACPERIVTLTRAGAEMVADRLIGPSDDIGWAGRRQQPKDYLFLQHFLAVSDFRITLTQACANDHDIDLLGFIPEYRARSSASEPARRYVQDVVTNASDHDRKITHSPDGVFALTHGGRSALFFLEIDRGTEVLSNPAKGFLKMVRFYLAYLRDGGYQRYKRDFGIEALFRGFRTLVVTTSPARLRNMREACGQLSFTPNGAKRFIWLATAEAVRDPAILTRSLVSCDPADETRYSILPEKPSTA